MAKSNTVLLATVPDTFFHNEGTHSDQASSTSCSTAAGSFYTPADTVAFKSSDDQIVKVQRTYIESGTGALNYIGIGTKMPEAGAILRLLFQFIGPGRYPNLLNETFETVCKISKAAEMYEVYSAMSVCSERMWNFGDRHPKLVLLYAAYNNYPHIVDAVAPRVVTSENLEYITPLLPESFRVAWIKYNARWAQALTEITTYDPTNWYRRKSCWRDDCTYPILLSLAVGVHVLGDLDKVFTSSDVENHTRSCESCAGARQRWRQKAEEIINGIGAFSKYFLTAERVGLN